MNLRNGKYYIFDKDKVFKDYVSWFSFIKDKYLVGKILSHNKYIISIEFITYIDGHECSGEGRYGYCWNAPRNSVVRYIPKKELTDVLIAYSI